MKKNMGITDRTIRVIIAIALLALNIKGIISGGIATVAVIVAVIFIVTGFLGFCPLYRFLGVRSFKKNPVRRPANYDYNHQRNTLKS